MKRAASPNMAADGLGQRREQRGGPPHPVGQGGAAQVERLAGVDLRLAVERQVIGVLGDQNMGEQPWPGPSALDRARWQ